MKNRASFIPFFLVFLVLSFIIFGMSKSGLLKPIEPIFQTVFAPVQSFVYESFSAMTKLGFNFEKQNLKNENMDLTKKLVDQNRLIADNKALRDQFETQNPKSTNLVSAQIIGAPGFIPGVSVPETFTINKGEADGVKSGNAVVVKNNLIGKIYKTTKFLSSVVLITNSTSSFTARTMETDALGVLKGQGGEAMVFDNVVLSDTLTAGDTVLTKGDVEVLGTGLMPELVVGKITAISKNPSSLFQKAKVESIVDFSKLSNVFVVLSQ
jgi:rod shape-determining protein MreC